MSARRRSPRSATLYVIVRPCILARPVTRSYRPRTAAHYRGTRPVEDQQGQSASEERQISAAGALQPAHGGGFHAATQAVGCRMGEGLPRAVPAGEGQKRTASKGGLLGYRVRVRGHDDLPGGAVSGTFVSFTGESLTRPCPPPPRVSKVSTHSLTCACRTVG